MIKYTFFEAQRYTFDFKKMTSAYFRNIYIFIEANSVNMCEKISNFAVPNNKVLVIV